MLEVIKANQKLSSRVTQKDLIRELVKRNIALKDVASIEYKQRQQRKRMKEKDTRMIKPLMKWNLDDAMAEERAVREDYMKAKHELYKTVNNKSKLVKKLRQIQHKYIEGVYNNNKESNKNKIENLKASQNVKVVTQNGIDESGMMNGVKVDDKVVDDYEEKKANIWGDAVLSEK